MRASLAPIRSSGSRRKSKRWVRLMIVAGTLWVSVVARMKTTWSGGSSMSLSSALNGVRAQHVDLVDDVDALAAARGAVSGRMTRSRASSTRPWLAASISRRRGRSPPGWPRRRHRRRTARRRRRGRAVDRLGQDAGRRGLAGAARPDEQVRVREAVVRHRAAQGGDDRLLAEEVREALGAEAAIERARRGSRGR